MKERDNKIVLPSAPWAERAVLGAVLAAPETYSEVCELLTSGDFGDKVNVVLWEALRGVIESGVRPDPMTVMEEVSALGARDVVGGLSTILSYTEDLPDVANIRWYAERVKEASKRRGLQALGLELLRSAAKAPINELIEVTSRGLAECISHTDNQSAMIGDLCEAEVKAARDRADGDITEVLPETGIPRLDAALCGMRGGQLILIGARPSVGKTSLLLQIADNVSVNQRMRVLFASLEMGRDEITARLLAARSGIAPHRITKNRLDLGNPWPSLEAAAALYKGVSLEIIDRGVETVGKLAALAHARKISGGLDLLVLDYIQLLSSGGRHGNRAEEVGAISRGLKVLASQLRIPILAASQLNRRSEEGGVEKKREPSIADLRESGSLENDANVVILLHRRIEGTHYEISQAHAIVAKNRNGPTGRMPMIYDTKRLIFRQSGDE